MKRACLFEKLARRGLQWTFRVQLAPTPQKETTEEKQNKNILKKKKAARSYTWTRVPPLIFFWDFKTTTAIYQFQRSIGS